MRKKWYKPVVTGDEYQGIDLQMMEIKRQLNQKSGSPLDPARVRKALQRIIEPWQALELRHQSIVRSWTMVESGGQILHLDPVSVLSDVLSGGVCIRGIGETVVHDDGDVRCIYRISPKEGARQNKAYLEPAMKEVNRFVIVDVSRACVTEDETATDAAKRVISRTPDVLQGFGVVILMKKRDVYTVARVGALAKPWAAVLKVPKQRARIEWLAPDATSIALMKDEYVHSLVAFESQPESVTEVQLRDHFESLASGL